MAILRLTATVLVICLMVAAVPYAAEEGMLRIPSMPELDLLHKVNPKYPPEALRRQIQGTVRFEAVIGKDGHIERLRLLTGHPLLVRAAREAVQQWAYRPTLLRGKPVRVVTEIDVQFQLDSHGNPVKENNRKPTRTVAGVSRMSWHGGLARGARYSALPACCYS